LIRAVLGIVLLDLVYLGLGAAVLRATGARISGRIRFVGLALALGWAVFAIVASGALVLGLSLFVWQIVALTGAVAVAALLLQRERGGEVALPEPAAMGWRGFLGAGAAAVLASYLGLLVLRSLFAPADTNYDSWAFWLSKAQAIYFFGGLDTGPGGFTSFDNPEYPPAAPALDATVFRFAGGVETTALPFQHALLGGAFFVAAGALLSTRVQGWILWPSLLGLALAPNIAFYVEAALADLTVAFYIGLGAVACALWLIEEASGSLWLAGIFLAAASLTKTEGFMLSVVLVGALALASLVRPRRPWRSLLLLAAAPILALSLWKAWLAANDQPLGSVLYSVSDALRPVYLAERLDRLTYAAGELIGLTFDPQRWLLIAPLALLAGTLVLIRRPALGIFYLGSLGTAFAGLTSVYWISNADVVWHVSTSADRVAASLMVFAGVLLPLLLAELGRSQQRS
jgi:hypothetical protein